jgi:hypothetical protein
MRNKNKTTKGTKTTSRTKVMDDSRWSVELVSKTTYKGKDPTVEPYNVKKTTYRVTDPEGRVYKLEFERIDIEKLATRKIIGSISGYVKINGKWFELSTDEVVYIIGSILMAFLVDGGVAIPLKMSGESHIDMD